MALKPCRECGKEISTSAKKCPHCGIEKPGEMKAQTVLRKTGNFLMGLGLILTLLAFFLMF